jgi:putative membrane protein
MVSSLIVSVRVPPVAIRDEAQPAERAGANQEAVRSTTTTILKGDCAMKPSACHKAASLAVLGSILGLAGCSTTAQAPQTANLAPQDLQFITTTYQLVHFDLDACDVVQKAALTSQAQPVATKICADARHYAPIIKQQAASAGATLPDTLPAQYKARLVALNYHPQPNISVAFMRDEIESHENALAVYQDEMQNGRNAGYRRIAAQTLPVVQGNLRMLRGALPAGAPE